VFAFSSRYAKVYEPAGEKKLKGFVDANLGIDYRYSKIFSLFLNFNNIGAVRYYYWDNYPSQRFNLLGGLTYSF
jgi:outer membrane receptor protein involved in Fe transport